MRISFREAKELVLAAAHETLYRHSEWEAYDAGIIHKHISELFALGYTKRVLASLVLAELITSEQFDETSTVLYSLTDEGLARAEAMPSLATLKARFLRETDAEADVEIPASDRIVSLNHNQTVEFEAPVTELIEALETDNGDPDEPGLRERLIGQIKAGRELLRAGEFRAYLLYETLVRALGELIRRYGNPTIKSLADALLGAIIGQFFQS